jgi:DNA-binding SARP family transcriptional activator
MEETVIRPPAPVHFQLLGVPRFANGTPLPSRMGHKQLLLLTRLLLDRRPLTRESMIAFLWPEADEARARGSLRQALYVIRELIGEDAVVANRQTISLHSAPATDLAAFMQAVHAARWREAALLYRGRLLDGVQLKDATDADLWLELERRRVERLFEAAAFAHLRESRSAHDAQERLAIARRLRDTSPGSVRHWQHLLSELTHCGAADELRIEYAALGARIDTTQIDDAGRAMDLLSAFPNAQLSAVTDASKDQSRCVAT